MIDVGTATGLAQSFQYDQRINDQRFYDQQMKRAQAENEASLKAFEDDTDYMNAANSFDHNLIKANADKTIREMGEIIRNNPDYKYNPDVRRALKEKKVYLKSNPDVIRGMASDEGFKRLNDDLAKVAKNPNQYDAGAYQELLAKKQNYLQYGHQDGKEAAQKFGAQAFVYDKPEDFIDLPVSAIELGNKYKSDKYKQDGNGGYHQLVDENTLRPLAENLYNQRKRQIQVQHGVKSDEEGIQVAADMIRAGIKLERKFGEPNHALIAAQWKHKMDQLQASGKPIDVYKEMFINSKSSMPGPELLTKVIGVKPSVKIYDADKNFVANMEGREFIPDGTYTQVGKVSKVAPHKDKYGNISQYEKTKDENIGVVHGYTVYSEADIDETGWLDDPAMKRNIEVVTMPSKFKDGKGEKQYRVRSQHTFNPQNPAYQFKLNNEVGETGKQINELNSIYGQTSSKQVVQNGVTYTFNENTGKYE